MRNRCFNPSQWVWMGLLACLGWVGGSAIAWGGGLWHTKPPGKQIATIQVYDFSPLVSKIKPAVFNLSVSGVRPSQVPRYWFFRGQRQFRSKGSGFLINAQGYALTNNHVVQHANQIEAELDDKTTYRVQVVGRSPELDIALIRLVAPAGTKFPFVYLGDSLSLKVGEPVIAIGNARGLGFSVTAGIVSAKGRAINDKAYENYIQTDAAINHGNSGGPLFNRNGEVIGINTAILRGGRGIGFAVPINIVKQILPQLKRYGKVQRAQLGVSIQRVTPDLARSFRLRAPVGAFVAEVVPGSPAHRAGIKVGDVILAFNGQVVQNFSDLPRLVAFNLPGSKGRILLLRNGKRKVVLVRLARFGQRVAVAPQPPSGLNPDPETSPNPIRPRTTPSPVIPEPRATPGNTFRSLKRLGIGVRGVPASVRKSLGLESGGVQVTFVKRGSASAQNGLRRGDVIVEVNRVSVTSARHFLSLVSKVAAGENVLLLVRRSNAALFLAFPLP